MLKKIIWLIHEWKKNMKTGAELYHHSPYLIFWIRSQLNESNPLEDKQPWVVFKAKVWLDSVLTKEMIIFEYGSGGSTMFFAMKVKKVVSVEHDFKWSRAVKTQLEINGIKNCKYIIQEPDKKLQNNLNVSIIEDYSSEYPGYEEMNFKQYVTVINDFKDNFFDLIFIDGRCRASCLIHSIKKVRPGGFIILDNSERTRYSIAKNQLKHWKKKEFFGPGPYETDFWETTIWQRPIDKN